MTDPSGVEWEVSRRWLERPRWVRWRTRVDGADTAWGIPGDEGLAAVVVMVLLVVLVVVGLPLLLFVGGLLLGVGGLVLRIAFRRPWLVEAKSERGELAWRVRGTLGSRRAIRLVAQALGRGERDYSPPGAEHVLPDPILRASGR